jgi:hypothetical protein
MNASAETKSQGAMVESTLRVTYILQKGDLAVAAAVAQETLKPLVKGRWLVTVLSAATGVLVGAALMAIIQFGTWERENWGHLSAILFSLGALLTCMLAQRVGLHVSRSLALRASGPFPVKQWMSVGADGIRAGDEYTEGRWAWAAVQEVRECRSTSRFC